MPIFSPADNFMTITFQYPSPWCTKLRKPLICGWMLREVMKSSWPAAINRSPSRPERESRYPVSSPALARAMPTVTTASFVTALKRA